MSDAVARAPILRRPALPHSPLGHPGAALRMAALGEGHVLHALAAPGSQNAAERLASISDGGSFAVRPLSPGQWFVVCDAALSPAELAAKRESVGGLVALSDQSSGRVRIALSGPAAEAVLARGTAVDVSPAAFPVGRSAPTLFGHLGIHLTRTGDEAFELMVLRSFAESLWEELEALGETHFRSA